MKAIKVFEQVDNKTIGIFKNDNKYLALTFTKSKTFKTLKGAENWIKKYL